MNINTTPRVLGKNEIADQLVAYLKQNETELNLNEAEIYYKFPILKDLDEDLAISELLLVSRFHGVVAIETSGCVTTTACTEELRNTDESLENLFSLLFSRLIRNKYLRKSKTELAFPTQATIYAPLVEQGAQFELESDLIRSFATLNTWLRGHAIEPLSIELYGELVATIEGAKGIVRPKQRNLEGEDTRTKGYLANLVESEIASFDVRQKHGYIPVVDGIQRIRGLAGSGKTVVLAMKAALLHLANPDATILYTFYTKSLYQQIRRLITRFYRQFDDRDPNWSKVRVMHGWGGYNDEGVLFNAFMAHGLPPINFGEAAKRDKENPFLFACNFLKKNAKITPLYDYILIDEGQDFPAEFFQICLELTRENRLVFAFDELQNIFRATTPTMEEILGDRKGAALPEAEDTILYKCYRNPREIIVCAHALGFGIYSDHIVQMLEKSEQWADVGYHVIKGDFVEGSQTIIERPRENSLTSLSDEQTPEELVQSYVAASFDEEVAKVTEGILRDISEGLRPDDILVTIVDDRNAGAYSDAIIERLTEHGIQCNNMNADRYNIRDFQQDGFVTISTVHKAKGNEAYMVYVVGVDALFASAARVQTRNRLFTAMTRAKGWLRVSGVGPGAAQCQKEIQTAMQRFPNLEFIYPSKQQLKVIKRDLAEKDSRLLKAERKLDEVMGQMTAEEIQRYVEGRMQKKPGQK